MRIFFIGVITALCLFTGCQKEPVKTWDVQYRAISLSTGIPTYRLTYILPNGSSKIVGPISSYHWESDTLRNLEDGALVSLQIEILSGKGHYEIQILRNGAIHEKGILPLGDSELFIESHL